MSQRCCSGTISKEQLQVFGAQVATNKGTGVTKCDFPHGHAEIRACLRKGALQFCKFDQLLDFWVNDSQELRLPEDLLVFMFKEVTSCLVVPGRHGEISGRHCTPEECVTLCYKRFALLWSGERPNCKKYNLIYPKKGIIPGWHCYYREITCSKKPILWTPAGINR